MSAHLKFFELEQSPFEGEAQARVVLGTRALRDTLDGIRGGLDEGSTHICVTGGPGIGKTSLARALPKLLGDAARVAVVLDPGFAWASLRETIAKQWRLSTRGLARTALIEAARDRRLVIVIDRAERASEEFLDHLDLILSHRDENENPVVQGILLARSSGSDSPGATSLIPWLDRTRTRQIEFAPLAREGIESYIQKRLKRAGWRGERLFSRDAAFAIHDVTGGVPGEVSQLCEQLLSAAAALNRRDIDVVFVQSQCNEGESADESPAFQDDALSAPASPEELRAILGSVPGRHGRALATAAIVAVLGGLAFAWLAGGAGPAEPIGAANTEWTRSGETDSIESGSTAGLEAPPAVLARLRGPVSTMDEPMAGQPSTDKPPAPHQPDPRPMAANPRTPETTEGDLERNLEGEIPEDDLVDMRPAAMLSPAARRPFSGE